MTGRHYTPGEVLKVLSRIESGEKQALIARETGICDSTISMWRLKHGLRSKGSLKPVKPQKSEIITPRFTLKEANEDRNFSKLSRETLAAIVRDLLK